MDERPWTAEPSPGVAPATRVLRREELEALLQASQALVSSRDLQQSLQAIVAQAAVVSGIPTVRLFLLEGEASLLRFRIGVGLPVEAEQDLTVPVGEGLSGHVAATRLPLAVTGHSARYRR